MQEGDLADGPLPDILRLLAAAHATGGVHVRRRDERGESADAVLFLREGRLYAATAPGPRPLLGVRLVAAGAVTREALEEALESQAGELAGWRLGELLVHLGYVDGEIVAEFVVEQILDTVAEVSAWVAGGWRFRRGEKTREADGQPLDIEDVLERVIERRQSWHELEEHAGGATAVPQRVEIDESLTAQQIPLAQALLGEVDGVRTLAELATRCGLTTYEAGYVLAQLVEVGAVRLTPREEPAAPNPPPPVTRSVAAAAQPPAVATITVSEPTQPAAEVVPFDAEDPLGLAGRFDASLDDASPAHDPVPVDPGPADAMPAEAAPTPEPAPATGADDLSDLFGAGEVDLGTQLAVLARQAEEARWAAESRRRDEVRARRAVPVDAAPEVPIGLVPEVPIGLEPLPGELAVPVPDVTEMTDVTEVAEVAEGHAVPLVAPYEPIGLAPIETYGLSVAETSSEPPAPRPAVDAVADEAPTEVALEERVHPEAEPASETLTPESGLQARIPRLTTRSAPVATDLDDDLPGALANLRGAIDLEALDAPDPAENAWPAMDENDPPVAPTWATPHADVAADRNELQSALSDFGDEQRPYVEAHPDDAAWADAAVATSWNPDEAHDFTPDDEEPPTDTAALLRELSFLGLDDIPAPPRIPPPPRTPSPRQAPVPTGKGKRKSIFGR